MKVKMKVKMKGADPTRGIRATPLSLPPFTFTFA